MSLDEFRQEFLTCVNQAIEDKYQTYAIYTHDPHIFDLLTHARNLIASGKCLRPYLAYTMYLACGGQHNLRVIDALVSLELFHTFALIHDDIIDEGTTRHGILTVHEYVKYHLDSTQRHITNPEHYAHSQAILVGDLFFSWALMRFQHFSDLAYHNQANHIFEQMVDEVAIGQMLDVDTMTRKSVDETFVETKMSLKTASYTFIHPLHIGATFAGRHTETLTFCRNLGHYLGVAFQTQDDILDIIGNPHTINKSVLSDLREHQHTLLTEYIQLYGNKADKDHLYSLWGHDLHTVSQQEVIDLFERSGALSYARSRITQYLNQARELCYTSEFLTPEGCESLIALIEYLEQRSV